MGYRTVVILYNDEAYAWENDPNLGKKIGEAGAKHLSGRGGGFHGGEVVEVCHADIQALAVVDGYQYRRRATSYWVRGENVLVTDLKLLKEAANSLGYRLIKKSSK